MVQIQGQPAANGSGLGSGIMASGRYGAVIGSVHRLFGGGSLAGMGEAELLRRFATRRDPAAFEGLVARHGPMVLGVCRRILGDAHDVDDAFQATFLILVKKAGSLRDPDLLGPWLHGVAHRVAVRSRANAARRRSKEMPGAEEVAMVAASGDSSSDRQEMRAVLDEEIARLPERFRRPVILCYLEGLTHDEAAVRLKCPVGTVRSRMSAARTKLRDRLSRRGVTLPATLFGATLAAESASAAVPQVLIDATVSAAVAYAASGTSAALAGTVSAGAASLAEGVSSTMFVHTLKLSGAVLLTAMLTVGGAGAVAWQAGGGGGGKAEAPTQKPAEDGAKQAEAYRVEAVRLQLMQKADMLQHDVDVLNALLTQERGEIRVAPADHRHDADDVREADPVRPDRHDGHGQQRLGRSRDGEEEDPIHRRGHRLRPAAAGYGEGIGQDHPADCPLRDRRFHPQSRRR